jgi:hypothetical protein
VTIINLPAGQIQVKVEQVAAVGHTATADEKPRLWQIMPDVRPSYDACQARTVRDIPVVVLSTT